MRHSNATESNELEIPMTVKNLHEFGQLIRHQRQRKGLTLDQVAHLTGISKPYLSNIETARLAGPPTTQKLTKIEGALGIAPAKLVNLADWLRTPLSVRRIADPDRYREAPAVSARHDSLPRRPDGAVNLDALLKMGMRQSEQVIAGGLEFTHPDSYRDTAMVRLAQIPLINRVAAGKPAEFTDMDYPPGFADGYIAAPVAPAGGTGLDAGGAGAPATAALFALRIEGDSMEPEYGHGDIVVFSTTDTPRAGDDCLVRLDDAENFSTTFKRITYIDTFGKTAPDGTMVLLAPLNSRHAPRTVERNRITGLYPALWRITPAASRQQGTAACGAQEPGLPAARNASSPPPRDGPKTGGPPQRGNSEFRGMHRPPSTAGASEIFPIEND